MSSNIAAKSVAGLLTVLVVALLARYGTLSPCGMLTKDIRSAIVTKLAETGPAQGFEGFGQVLGAVISGPMIESMIGSMRPTQCVKALWRVNFSADGTVDELIASANVDDQATMNHQPKVEALPPPLPDPEWTIDASRSPIDDSETVVLSVEANKAIRGAFGAEQRPLLILRCKENETNAYVPLGFRPETQRDSDYHEYAPFTVRFGSSAAETVNFTLSTDHEALFFPNPVPSIKRMLQHESLLIEVQPSMGSPQIVIFRMQGLAELIPQLQRACHWQ